MANNRRRHMLIIFIIISLSGCAQYSRDMLWENKIKPTPYDVPDQFVRPGRWSDEEVTYACPAANDNTRFPDIGLTCKLP